MDTYSIWKDEQFWKWLFYTYIGISGLLILINILVRI